jgi:hypothetical protein
MATLTLLHVLLSLVGICSGFAVLAGLFNALELDRWTSVFLATTLLTSLTAFLFPFNGFTPGIGVGIVSLIVLVIAIYARYGKHLAGAWRRTYAVTAVIALYLNVFVLITQLFGKVPVLHEIAPTLTAAPFAATHIVVLTLFVGLGIQAAHRFRGASAPAARAAGGSS